MKIIKSRKREKGGKELTIGNSLNVTCFKESTKQQIIGIRERANLANGKGRATNAIRQDVKTITLKKGKHNIDRGVMSKPS